MIGRRIQVGFLITDLDVGGAERNLAMLAAGLDGRRFAVSVASLMGPGRLSRELGDAGVGVTDIHMTDWTDVGAIGRVVQWLRRIRPDILHTWLFHANILGGCAGAVACVPVVVWSVRVAEPRRLHLVIGRLAQRLADCVLTNSQGLREYMIGRGFDARRLAVIPNAVDVRRFTSQRGEKPGGTKTVLFIGRLARQKGVDVLLRAAHELSRRIDVRFLVVGDGPERTKLVRLAKNLGRSNVQFTGHSDRVPELLSQADVLVLPSRWEGMPNVVLEALAARCPVVGTDVTGTRDLIQDGRNGLLVPPEDHRALASAIERVIREPSLGKSLAERGYETARGHSTRAMIEAHETLYMELLARGKTRR
jgi:glycosyltransferase involved in cell wall biosynthesis